MMSLEPSQLFDGSTCDIIRDGRFVLEGVEELNKPLDTLDAESK